MNEMKRLLERSSNIWSADSLRLILTPSKTAKSTYFYAQEAGYFQTSYPYFAERENLDSFLIVYTLSGKGFLEYEGSTHFLTKGQCFFINCSVHHLYHTGEDQDWEFLWLHFNGNSSLGYYNEFVRNGFKILDCRDDSCIRASLERILELHRRRNLTTELLTSGLICGMLTELLLENVTNQADSFAIPDYIRQIAREIDRNFRLDLPLACFEELTHRSRYHILKEFKKYIGVTIHEYLIQTRISYAKELLKYSSLSVSDITFEIGMHNVTHFINLFKSREEKTPLSYRKMWK